MKENHNYVPDKEDIKSVIDSAGTLRIKLSDLELEEDDHETSYFRIDTKNYENLNKIQRPFAERVFGQGPNFIENMKMFSGLSFPSTGIYVLNPKYALEHIKKDRAIVRACWLCGYSNLSHFDAYIRNTDFANFYLRGVPNPDN